MRKNRKNSGFTMAELLIVIAILGVLFALAFVGVASHLRSMAKMEDDNYAKEIFIAAQNHLTMAKSQGYLGRVESGTQEPKITIVNGDDTVTVSEPGVYYYAIESGSPISSVASTSESILNLMLPFGSIDDTVRSGGSYIIRYHKEAGEVLDVFYWSETGRYPFTDFANDSANYYKDFMLKRGEENKNELQDYTYLKGNHSVIGWYGGEEAKKLASGAELNKPKLKVKNAEKLTVEVEDTNNGTGNLKLLITGVTSGACKEINVKAANGADGYFPRCTASGNKYTVTLDDITTPNMHFYDLFCDKTKGYPGSDLGDTKGHFFIPGENITIQAVAYNSSELTNVAYSSKRTTNSLFASAQTKFGKSTASITNIRHLENLDPKLSNLNYGEKAAPANAKQIDFETAVQPADLSWSEFCSVIAPSSTLQLYKYNKDGTTDEAALKITKSDCYYPVTLVSVKSYDGKNHSVFDVKTDFEDTADATGAGLFGKLSGAKTIKNLKLVNFNITGTGDAGTLAGKIETVESKEPEIFNVVAISTSADGTKTNVKSSGGNAGGLIGSVTGGFVEKCAAQAVVQGSTNAGGLIGAASGGADIAACYSGGHTNGADYRNVKETATSPIVYNVTATSTAGNAGGLIGNAGDSLIKYCYSTCSVKGAGSESAKIGGFAGTAAGTISYGYSTGLVADSNRVADINNASYAASTGNEGAFIGAYTGTDINAGITNCSFFEIINEREVKDKTGFEYLRAVGGTEQPAGIKAIDEDAESYNDFSGNPASDWKAAIPTDSSLVTYYNGKYNLKTVAQLLGATEYPFRDGTKTIDTAQDFVAVQYGDWPAPEIFVINTPSS